LAAEKILRYLDIFANFLNDELAVILEFFSQFVKEPEDFYMDM